MSATPAVTQRGLRGSQKLLEGLAKNGETPSMDEIKKALAVPATVNYNVLRWLVRGVPPAYLHLDATVQVPMAQLGEFVNHVVKLNDSTLNLNILVNGIPNPEIANVHIFNTPGEV
jgi:hypothetical protein